MANKIIVVNKEGTIIAYKKCPKTQPPRSRVCAECGEVCYDSAGFMSKAKAWKKIKGNREKHPQKQESYIELSFWE
jgi:hypothetical protein